MQKTWDHKNVIIVVHLGSLLKPPNSQECEFYIIYVKPEVKHEIAPYLIWELKQRVQFLVIKNKNLDLLPFSPWWQAVY